MEHPTRGGRLIRLLFFTRNVFLDINYKFNPSTYKPKRSQYRGGSRRPATKDGPQPASTLLL